MLKEKSKPGRPLGSVKTGKRSLSKQDLFEFIKAVNRRKILRDQVMFQLTIWLGLRVMELVSIKLDDIDWQAESIHIKGIKNGRKRTYCVGSTSKLWNKLSRLANKKTKATTGQVYLFSSPQDITKPISTQAVKMLFKRYGKKAGLGKERSIHDLRHTVGTIMAEKGYNAIQISRWLRHKNIKSTQVYFEQVVFEKDDKRMAVDFSSFL